MMIDLDKKMNCEEINNYLEKISTLGDLHKQIELYKFPDGVSKDFIGNKHIHQ